MNPSATSANPEYAFNTVITTAIKKSVSSFIQFKDFKDRPLTHVSTTDGGGRRETLQETEHRVCSETPGRDCRCARRHGYERAHRRHVSAKERAVYEMAAGKSQRAGGHASSKLQEGDDGSGERHSTCRNSSARSKETKQTADRSARQDTPSRDGASKDGQHLQARFQCSSARLQDPQQSAAPPPSVGAPSR